ncbi:MAG TPA: 16S rRNA (cytosine(967)-C(5))-methyltransferase RsmB, partial [Burkholderiaceae bacterium]|nr:16S rRNA (cytosine(967)-C(5))-methyltransferase RsmB [Burkholderiaceae bacterium]
DALYTAVRHLAGSERIVERLASRPPTADVAALLAVSLAQLQAGRHSEYTAVDQAVAAAQYSPQTRPAAGFINALLRNFLRQREGLMAELQRDATVRYNLPPWWIDHLRHDFPRDWTTIAESQQQMPPLILRINAARTTADAYLLKLSEHDIAATRVGAQAIWMHQPRPVGEIPGFAEGDVSVQDAGAQLAAVWLAARPGMRVLDACAAPGGKTAHLAELGATDLTAVEIDDARAARIADNLRRCHLTARVVIGDAARPDTWQPAAGSEPFDRILLDAPCTASGIVRRHPDIPWLRRPADVAQLTTLQGELVDALWPLLSVGGRLLYVVCSLFPDEGRVQIARFVERHIKARQVPLPAAQLLPTSVTAPATASAWHGSALPTVHDGFFYALLEKTG